MDPKNLAIGIIFLIQNTVGILGNVFLLAKYLVIYYKKHKVKPLDLILIHLVMVNILIILSKGMVNTMIIFVLKLFFNDWSYQLFMYVLRVFRIMSIATICLLSVFQAIMISPRNSFWKNLRVKSPKDIGVYISLCWFLYIMVNVLFPLYMSIKLRRKNITKETDFKYYTVVGHDKFTIFTYIAFFVFPELVISVLITWSSSSMIVFLYRHKQRVQHIRSTYAFHRNSPESRATQNILVLVFTFLAFYTLSTIAHGCSALLSHQNWWPITITSIITLCFPSLSPFLIMSQSSPLSRLCFLWIKNTESSNIIVTI
ncbi:vomeronasal type-1 receptor 4-like [Peromyscus californicus insignis]|uniref:vomeronasal type-1 receptor 4-like n=1 Tax=Peromyscus californicus insignis TaxID=564181 RepID=UPI0022A6C1FD|nr:vomeronasal type-1 receptor 4-like [Peromyscus californicus insignis]